MEFGDHVRVKTGAIGLLQAERAAGRRGIVVDRASDKESIIVEVGERPIPLGSYLFVRFDDEQGATVFFDWLRASDLIPDETREAMRRGH